MRKTLLAVCFLVVGFTHFSMAAQSDPNQLRKTIDIQASAKVEAPAEVATVKIGYANRAATKDAAYQESTRTSQRIVRVLLDQHVPLSAIETESLALGREEEQGGGGTAKVLRFSALQEWRIHVAAADAQKIVDIAVGGGATNVGGVEWDVKDPQALEAQAYAAAIDRAKEIAGQTASHTGIKLGEIVSIDNFSTGPGFGHGMGGAMQTVESQLLKAVPLTLYPQKIERQASVKITYAIAP
jgi:uncharacterized protein YggE